MDKFLNVLTKESNEIKNIAGYLRGNGLNEIPNQLLLSIGTIQEQYGAMVLRQTKRLDKIADGFDKTLEKLNEIYKETK